MSVDSVIGFFRSPDEKSVNCLKWKKYIALINHKAVLGIENFDINRVMKETSLLAKEDLKNIRGILIMAVLLI